MHGEEDILYRFPKFLRPQNSYGCVAWDVGGGGFASPGSTFLGTILGNTALNTVVKHPETGMCQLLLKPSLAILPLPYAPRTLGFVTL